MLTMIVTIQLPKTRKTACSTRDSTNCKMFYHVEVHDILSYTMKPPGPVYNLDRITCSIVLYTRNGIV